MSGKTHFRAGSGNSALGWAQLLSNYFWGQPIGNVFWVSSVTGSDSGSGFSPEDAFATIAHAIGQCSADNGDVIAVMPGHVETIGSTALAINVAGVQIIGLGIGRQRGSFVWSNAAGYLSITAARVSVQNLTFVGTGVATVTQMVNVSAADCTIQYCEFEHANSTNQATDVIVTTAGANRLWVDTCDFHGSANAGTNHAVSIVGGTDSCVSNCNFQGAYHASQGIIRTVTTDAVNLVIEGNTLQNQTASNTKSLVFTAASTGQIRFNTMQILSATAPITGAAMSWVSNNYYANAIATAGTLI